MGLSTVVVLGFALAALNCDNAQCRELRDELFKLKRGWQACTNSFDCIIVGGNQKDCSGVMSCDFAVNRQFRDQAEERVARLPTESVDCHECSNPNCETGKLPYCEPVTHQCVIIDQLLDGSAYGSYSPPPASGGGTSVEPVVDASSDR